MAAELQGRLNAAAPSLFGGAIAVGIGIFGLWLLIERNLGYDGAGGDRGRARRRFVIALGCGSPISSGYTAGFWRRCTRR